MDQETEKHWLWIHQAIHNRSAKGVRIHGTFYPVDFTRSGLRSITYQGQLFMQQNPDKDSDWAQMARSGSEITWVIREGQDWGRIRDGVIEKE